MTMNANSTHLLRHPPGRRLGLTFAEIMFAVILLGIGFIMIAGIFPVAIQQTQTTARETAGASLAHNAVECLSQFRSVHFPDTGSNYQALPDWVQMSLGEDMICRSDPRFGWTAIYRKSPGENGIQVVIFTAQAMHKDRFDERDVAKPQSVQPMACLTPRPITVTNLRDANDPADEIQFRASGVETFTLNGLAEGTLVVLGTTDRAGRTFRLGQQIGADSTRWYLAPGSDLRDNTEALSNVSIQAWVLGKGFNYEADAGARPFTGNAMDIDVYTTFILLK